MRYTKYYTSSFLLLLLVSCSKVIDVNVPNGGERLVIEASIVWEKGTLGNEQVIKLSKSTEYFSANKNSAAIGANVSVTNLSTGSKFFFKDQKDGTYAVDDFIPVLGDSYTLSIAYNGGQYSATEQLVPVSKIESVEQEASNGFGGNEVSLQVIYNDPPNRRNYYLGVFKFPSSPLQRLEPSSDEFYDGNSSFIQFDDEMAVGDSVEMKLQGISENYYNYISILSSQAGGDGGPFQTTPVRLKGNCVNTIDENEEVLGFFRLSEADNIIYIVQ